MELIAVVTVLALMQFYWFGIEVSQVRGRHGLKAPVMFGHPEFDRMFRVQQNTMELLVMFVPVLWLFGYYVNPLWGAGIGAVYLVGRFVYRYAYVKDPGSRSLGFAMSLIPISVMLLVVLIVSTRALL